MDSASPLRKFPATISGKKRVNVEVLYAVCLVDEVKSRPLAESHAKTFLFEWLPGCRIMRNIFFALIAKPVDMAPVRRLP